MLRWTPWTVRPLEQSGALRWGQRAASAWSESPTRDGPHLLGLTNWIGRPIDLHASAAGKLLLAELDDRAAAAWIRRERPRRLTPRTLTTRGELLHELARVREQGWAEIDGESEVGLASVAVPVRDPDGNLVAMLGYSGPAERLDRPALVPPLKRAATRLA